jgi:hypothetical protein
MARGPRRLYGAAAQNGVHRTGGGGKPAVAQAGIFAQDFPGLTPAFAGFGRGVSAPSEVRA